LNRRRSGKTSGIALAATLFAVACGSRGAPGAKIVRVAAAADLRFALDELTVSFKRAHADIDLSVSYGSSGSFFAQLLNRAPFDVFLSADVVYPRQLAARGLTLPDSEFTYAVGRLVLWTRADAPVDVAGGLSALHDARVRHVAIANPEHAPYGRAAEAAMRSAGVFDRVAPKLVFGDNVSQALQFVQSGAADAGIVALSLALSPPIRREGRFVEIPPESYPPIEQRGAILSWAADADAARRFRTFMISADARAVLNRYGFSLPGG
jgi:molybdate transport system substrate-binding protein